MVDSRKETFEKEGLTRDTHFIASTGIEGRRFEDNVYVSLDAYAVKGIASNQVNYLHVPDHMNPTHEYGVTFERGSTVDYGDRRHVFISGTASIDNKGIILHLNDAEKQLSRIISNINALLTKADATFSDVAEFIVYLRDAKDYDLVNKYLHSRFPQIPKVIVLAAVCRPDWLVEIECIAVKKVKNEGLADY
jgi:enamine deaminase RidA (YjgF/YER057c/UK114 family)